jgi:uncharacterized membrane protein YhaH (DUF805 family)
MNFQFAWLHFLRNAFVFEGRTSRPVFLQIALSLIAASAFISVVVSLFFPSGSVRVLIDFQQVFRIFSALSLVLILPMMSLLVRRFQDAGWSSWWLFGTFISVVLLYAGVTYASDDMIASSIQKQSDGLMDILVETNIVGFAATLFLFSIALRPSKGMSRYIIYPRDAL